MFTASSKKLLHHCLVDWKKIVKRFVIWMILKIWNKYDISDPTMIISTVKSATKTMMCLESKSKDQGINICLQRNWNLGDHCAWKVFVLKISTSKLRPVRRFTSTCSTRNIWNKSTGVPKILTQKGFFFYFLVSSSVTDDTHFMTFNSAYIGKVS